MDRAASFVRSRSEAWSRFARLAGEYRASGRVPPERVLEFSRDYRGVAADLSAARAMGCPREVLLRLNGLMTLGHGIVYRRKAGGAEGRPRGPATRLLLGFPMAFWDHPRLALAALALFLVPAAMAFAYVAGDEGRVHEVFPTLESVIRPADGTGTPRLNVVPATLSAFYVVNNTLVAMKCLAYGLLLGFGTAFFLLLNGMLLGALGGHFYNRGDLAGFWPQILPHGVTEFLAVFAASLAGLLLAKALWAPGEYSRRDALTAAGPEVGTLALGTVLLMAWSALVESYFTRSVDDDAARNLFALLAAAAVAGWFLVARRVVGAERARASSRP